MGLVLSSGGAKGFSYVGVIQVLEKLGLEFDIIAGSSFGAVVGALWARGYDGDQLEDIALRFRNWMHLLKIIDHVVDIRRGLIGGHRMEKYLRTLLEDAHFSELSIPLEITATDIENLHSKLIDSGDVASALHASSAIPGICVPTRRNGHLYIDGGIANPLPVQSLKDRGIERIIAVSTVLTHDQSREMGRQRMADDGAFQKNHPIIHFLNKRLNLFAHGNAFDTLMRSIEAAHIRLVERDAQLADLVLQPLPHNSRWQDFTNPQRYVDAGRKTATENVDALLSVEAARREGAMR
jgi:NTE family protein